MGCWWGNWLDKLIGWLVVEIDGVIDWLIDGVIDLLIDEVIDGVIGCWNGLLMR